MINNKKKLKLQPGNTSFQSTVIYYCLFFFFFLLFRRTYLCIFILLPPFRYMYASIISFLIAFPLLFPRTRYNRQPSVPHFLHFPFLPRTFMGMFLRSYIFFAKYRNCSFYMLTFFFEKKNIICLIGLNTVCLDFTFSRTYCVIFFANNYQDFMTFKFTSKMK